MDPAETFLVQRSSKEGIFHPLGAKIRQKDEGPHAVHARILSRSTSSRSPTASARRSPKHILPVRAKMPSICKMKTWAPTAGVVRPQLVAHIEVANPKPRLLGLTIDRLSQIIRTSAIGTVLKGFPSTRKSGVLRDAWLSFLLLVRAHGSVTFRP